MSKMGIRHTGQSHYCIILLIQAAQSQGAGDVSADMDVPIPSRIELSKNFSIVSTEDIPQLLAEEQQQRHHYPYVSLMGSVQCQSWNSCRTLAIFLAILVIFCTKNSIWLNIMSRQWKRLA